MNRKLLSLCLCSMLLFVALPMNVFAQDVNSNADDFSKIVNKPVNATIDVNTDLGLIIVTTPVEQENDYVIESEPVEVGLEGVDGPGSVPEKQASVTFSHKVYDRDGVLIATVYSTVTGWYSEVDKWSEISSITAEITGELAHDFTYTTSKSGNTGTLKLYFNGLSAGTFNYRINYHGEITNY
ncbi:hypothetical protein [Calorimonas adulescens]|uniref:DUF5626 domain-containing protein n=1 Tax=Calorimonas adulescens TaxID=2606906 RepID=A0A5D8QCA6_9THEO|nr:hypothetical protein [Calorimonas adulescens]TZE82315.1 hypothetical protein FWJ32_06085 [Calorimonas adulescens]